MKIEKLQNGDIKITASSGFFIKSGDSVFGESVILGKTRNFEEFSEEMIELTEEEKFEEMEKIIVTNLSEEELLEKVSLFSEFSTIEEYSPLKKDKVVREGLKLYKVVQPHDKRADRTPSKTPALFVEVTAPGVIDEWKQPSGAHDAYQVGDEVLFNGEIWINEADNNIYPPGVSGWKKKQQQ